MKFYMMQIASIGSMVLALTSSTRASSVTIGPNGINSDGLTLVGGTALTGAGIGIGQVELARPGKRVADGGFDDAANSNSTIDPADVFVRTAGGAGIANMNTDDLAHYVAGVMISTDTTDPDGAGPLAAPTGVAIGAELYSSATNPIGPDFDAEAAITAQHIAAQNAGDIRAINMSFLNPLVSPHVRDGNQLLTQFVDWSASKDDVLYVIGGRNFDTPEGASIPADTFNGMTVAASAQIGGVYRQVSALNGFDEPVEGDRTSVSLIAPGQDVDVTGLNDIPDTQSGRSIAAPHVTGTVALLQEYGDERIAAGATAWNVNARRHEVMKAVLMNSADKLIDDGTVVVPGGIAIPAGGLLGMERTVVMQDGTSTWFDSPANDVALPDGFESDIPLDEEMGAGHLNASRALTQFQSGEYESDGTDVPVIGWDYGTTTGQNDINRYRFNQELEAGSFISITLAWDRNVEFDVDGGTTGVYDIGDTFEEYVDDEINPPDDSVINDLDIFLLPRDGLANDAIAGSNAIVGTVEHLFFQIPTTGEYEFWVEQFDEETFSASQDYAVTWWALGTGPLLTGDLDGDGFVTAADVPLFVQALTNRAAYNAAFPSINADIFGDVDLNGIFDMGDLSAFNALTFSGTASAESVPEPSSLMLPLAAEVLLAARRQ